MFVLTWPVPREGALRQGQAECMTLRIPTGRELGKIIGKPAKGLHALVVYYIVYLVYGVAQLLFPFWDPAEQLHVT